MAPQSANMKIGDLVEIVDDWPPKRGGILAFFLRYYEDSGVCYILPFDTLEEEMYHRHDLKIVSTCEQERSTKDTA